MQEIIEKWLSLFGNPQMFLLEEWDSQIPRTFNWRENYNNNILVKCNQEQPYSLNFAPNGNYGKQNHVWEKATHNRAW